MLWTASLLGNPKLPTNWQSEIRRLAGSHARRVYLDGRSPTSREPASTTGFHYQVVTGDKIRSHLPWLYDIYRNDVCSIASAVSGYDLAPSNEELACININIVSGRASRYEWHVDSNPVTAILYATPLTLADGGAFAYKIDGDTRSITPSPGDVLIFMAEEVEHAVLPLKRECERISIPMTYYLRGQAQRGYEGLQEYLYGDT